MALSYDAEAVQKRQKDVLDRITTLERLSSLKIKNISNECEEMRRENEKLVAELEVLHVRWKL